mgnify:CR=1 FL=1
MPYIGPEPNPGQNREVDDISSSFNGSTTSFTLQVNSQNISPGSPNAIIVSLGGVIQNPSTDYNISSSTITFTTAPASGLSFFGLVLGQQVDIQSLADGTSPTMSAPSITGDLSIADKIVHTGDTDTAIRFPAADVISFENAGSERLRFSDNRILIAHTANIASGVLNPRVQINGETSHRASASINRFVDGSGGASLVLAKSRSGTIGTSTVVQTNDTLGGIIFAAADGTDMNSQAAFIDAQIDLAPGGDDTPGRLRFATTANGSDAPTERARIDANGNFLIGQNSSTAPGQGNTTTGICLNGANAPRMHCSRNGSAGLLLNRNSSDGNIALFYREGVQKGNISITTSAVAYNTSVSDRSLKKNFEDWTEDVLALFKNVNPQKFNFNFQEDTDPKVKGFVAQDLVASFPEAYNKSDDTDLYQFNPSGMVVYLMKALQESATKIETLETKVAALEAA